ncbi:Aste57867_19160 [Aphanomyces stellatus]|uniref:Aste57867_19160 protein n=1 Tax=Aphanomyces stellatus TaxID=120398 RepID=A0A485LDL7_9STRA|nr:hypothetical protein As57867_019096 [Aphanomyces stellatus]VFT95882.1 Aste57867_19160 [Aphanomyces stellatus]
MEEDLGRLFEHLDGNKDGYLCVEDLPKAVRGLPLMTAWQLVAEMDKTGDGYVPLVEFQKSMAHLIKNDDGTGMDQFSWLGIWNTFHTHPPATTATPSPQKDSTIKFASVAKDEAPTTSKSSPSPPRGTAEASKTTTDKASMVLPPVVPPMPQGSDWIDKKAHLAHEILRRRSNRDVAEIATPNSEPLFVSMRSLLKPVPLADLPRSISQDDANALEESSPPRRMSSSSSGAPPPPPPFLKRRSSSASKLNMFLKAVPPNQVTAPRTDDISSFVRDDGSGDIARRIAHQASNETPMESPKRAKANSFSRLKATTSAMIDPEVDLFGQLSVEYRISDPEIDLFGPPSPVAAPPQQTQGISTMDAPSDDIDDNDEIDRLKADLLASIGSIKQAIAQFTSKDIVAAEAMLTSLLDIQTQTTTLVVQTTPILNGPPRSQIPHFLGAALKSFDKSSLLVVDDAEKPYHSVSIQHVEQAIKIRAFRKNVLSQIFPQIPDSPLSVLGDLFPDILIDTIEQMYEACARDLQSCFEVLSGLSEYTFLDSSLSPKQSYLRKHHTQQPQSDKKAFFGDDGDDDDDDDLDAPLFDVKGYTKPPKVERAPSSSSHLATPARKADTGTYFTLPSLEAPNETLTTQLPFANDDDATDLFARFESGQNMPEILSAWRKFNVDSAMHHSQIYPHLKRIFQPHLSYRQARIFEILDKKRHDHPLYTQKVAATRRVCVVGGGPVGLRTAIELALLGAHVIVVEKRTNFNRENILHLFPWVVHDLTVLGAKFFYRQFCMSSSHLHIGTRQLQCILLKIALLLGVTVYDNMAFDSMSIDNSAAAAAGETDDDGYRIHTTPPLPVALQRVSALVGAGGSHDTIGNLVGIERKTFSPSPAVGAVVIFPSLHTKEELAIPQFSWASQYNQDLFGRLKLELGVDVENIVYYREEVHYVVMTPKKASLIDAGVLETKDLNSVNVDVLHRYVKSVLTFFNIPCPVVGLDAKLFDFSQTQRADKAAVVLPHATSKLFVALVGDALLEPFWPQGLGINRGFLSALDTAFAISRLGKTDDAKLVADHDKHYKGCASLRLQSNIRKFTVDPASRYVI